MLTDADKAGIAATSAELINSTGETIIRRRYRRDPLPAGYDSDFRELAAGAPEPAHDDLALKAKIFWDVTNKKILAAYGPLDEATGLVHFPRDSDVVETDILMIRGGRFRIQWIKEPPLRGFLAAPIALMPGFPMEGALASDLPTSTDLGDFDGGFPGADYETISVPGQPTEDSGELDGGYPGADYGADS